MDQLLSTGEQQSVSLLAMAIEALAHPAISFTGAQIKLITDGVYTKARIVSIGTERILEELNEGKIVVVAGFQGVDENENITTLGRGGSDTSAVALAAALKARECEIYTDVDGIYTTDPRIYPKAAKMDEITYDEMLELASLGAGVMHNRSVQFGKRYDVKIHVRSSSEDKKGTIITHEVPKMEGVLVSGATVQKDLAQIGLVDIDNKPGNAARVFAHLANARVVINDIVQTERSPEKANISFTISKSDLADAQKAIKEIKNEVNCENVFIREDIAEISVVGVGMRTHYGVADKMFGALAKARVNIDSITTSEIRISCIVAKEEAERALQAVCDAFELDKTVEQRSKSNE
jgi:aspartate kinase